MRDCENMNSISHTEAIGVWAAIPTTVAFAPQVVRTWRVGGDELSGLTPTCFGTGYPRVSAALRLANGLTGLQILLRRTHAFRPASPKAMPQQPNTV